MTITKGSKWALFFSNLKVYTIEVKKMNKHLGYLSILPLIFLLATCSSGHLIGFNKPLKIGTASFSGAYYPTGGAMSKIVNREVSQDFSKVVSSKGSSHNINLLMAGQIHIGLAQADRHYEAYYGLDEWEDKGPQKKLRSIFSLYPQTINLIVTRSSGIRSLQDLKGRKINLGQEGSGELGNALDILKILKIDPKKDLKASYYPVGKMLQHFENGFLDGFFYTIGYPSMVLSRAASMTKVRLIPLTGMDSFLIKNPYYQTTLIPEDAVPGAFRKTKRMESIGVMTTVLTSEDIPEAIVYKFTKAIFENLEELKSEHSVLNNLNKHEMLTGLSAPLHPGAERYYRESGLLDEYDPVKRLFK